MHIDGKKYEWQHFPLSSMGLYECDKYKSFSTTRTTFSFFAKSRCGPLVLIHEWVVHVTTTGKILNCDNTTDFHQCQRFVVFPHYCADEVTYLFTFFAKAQ